MPTETPELLDEIEYARIIYKSPLTRERAKDFTAEFLRKPTEMTLCDFAVEYLKKMDIIRMDADGNIYIQYPGDRIVWHLAEKWVPKCCLEYFRACITSVNLFPDSEQKLQLNQQFLREWEKLHQLLSRFESTKSMKSLLELIKANYPVSNMDTPRCLYFKNGVAWDGDKFITDENELRKMNITKVCPNNYISWADVLADHGEAMQRVGNLLWSLSNEDKRNQNDVNSLLGYIMNLNNTQKKFFIIQGKTTNNGKTTFCKLLTNSLGDCYAVKLTPQAFAQPSRPSTQVFSDIGEAAGKIFCYTAEPDKSMIFNAGLIKDLTGGDIVKVNQKFKNAPKGVTADFVPLMECNNIPQCRDDTLFKSERMVIIDFEKQFPSGGENPLKTFGEEEYSCLLSYMIYLNQEQTKTGERFQWSNASITEYIRTNINIYAFLLCETEAGQYYSVETSELWMRYVAYCRDEKDYQLGKQEFLTTLRELGYTDTRLHNKRGMAGLKLKTE